MRCLRTSTSKRPERPLLPLHLQQQPQPLQRLLVCPEATCLPLTCLLEGPCWILCSTPHLAVISSSTTGI